MLRLALNLVFVAWAPLFGSGCGEVERLFEADHLGGWAEGLEAGALLLELLFGVVDGLDGETDAALDFVDLDDAGFDFVRRP